MPGTHISLEQRQHAHRQFTAGVSSAVIKKNQRKLFGTRARIPSRRSIFRYGKAAGARRCRHFHPGQSLTRRHKRLLREAMERNARNSTSELSAMSSGLTAKRSSSYFDSVVVDADPDPDPLTGVAPLEFDEAAMAVEYSVAVPGSDV